MPCARCKNLEKRIAELKGERDFWLLKFHGCANFKELEEQRAGDFLRTMFNDLDNINEGTDSEVLAELQEAGIDVEKVRESFMETIKRAKLKKWLTLFSDRI